MLIHISKEESKKIIELSIDTQISVNEIIEALQDYYTFNFVDNVKATIDQLIELDEQRISRL